MLKTLSVLAALGLVAVSSAAFAEEKAAAPAAAPAAEKAAAPAAAAPAAGATVSELKDGTKVKIEGDKVFVIGKDGKESAAPDGTHVLKDGKSVTTKGGLVVKQ